MEELINYAGRDTNLAQEASSKLKVQLFSYQINYHGCKQPKSYKALQWINTDIIG